MIRLLLAESLADALKALPHHAKGNTVVFCEDRLTLLAERAVLGDSGGTFDTEVTTFARFLSGERRILSKQGSVMKLASLIGRYGNELRCFGKGAAQAVYETIAQLSASRVDPAMLRRSAEETDGLLGMKLIDLAFLYEKYTAFLEEEGLLDENGYLALLPDAMRALRGKNAVFFVFPSFTRQALEGVRAAFAEADNVTGIFVDGGAAFCTHEASQAFLRVAGEFGGAAKSIAKGALSEEGRMLYETLFSPARAPKVPVFARSVHFCEADRDAPEDMWEELRRTCALIKRGIAEGARYRDFAVLVPDESYFLAAESVFFAYRLPFFMDKKRKFSEHPFCTFCLSLLGAAADGVLPESADAVASSLYFGENSDVYRNYLLKFGGYRGGVYREIKGEEVLGGEDREALVACRERMLALLKVFPARGKGETYAEGVRKLLSLTDAANVTERLAEYATGAERGFLSLAPLDGILDEIVSVAGGESFTAREFSTLLSSGLGALKIAMIPQSADAVLVGDATETKLAGTPRVFVLGLTDALPRASRDTALISDRDIGRLSELSVEVEPAIAVVNARARESLAENLCAFGEELYLFRPTGSSGGEAAESEALAYVKRVFRSAPMPELFPFDCSEEGPALLALLENREKKGRGEPNEFDALFAALSEKIGRNAVSILVKEGRENVEEAGKLYFGGDISPTLLESYFSCPYAGFLSHALRLKEREERAVQDTGTGMFLHTVLERVAPLFESSTEEGCRAAAERIARDLLAEPVYAPLTDTSQGSYVAERLIGESVSVALRAWRQLTQSGFRIGNREKELFLPDLKLKGRADRVDEAAGPDGSPYVRVIDYKTGEIDDSASSYYTGLRLQLALYLLAASEGKRAAGAFYFPARETYTRRGEEGAPMSGFYPDTPEIRALMDRTMDANAKKSELYKSGTYMQGMDGETFENFLRYARLVSEGAEAEMREGNVSPSPYDGSCTYCKYGGLCGFVGEPRKETAVKSSEIAAIAARGRGEE